MKFYTVRLAPEAEGDLFSIYSYIREQSASDQVARQYVARVTGFLASLETFPERGTARDDIRGNLRVIGFERRVSIAFVVEEDVVVVLRVLYGGQALNLDDE